MRLQQTSFCAKLVAVAFRTSEFQSYSHQKKFFSESDCTNTIYKAACELFDELWKGQQLRHIGIRVSELCGNDFVQISIFDDFNEKKKQLDKAIDQVSMKHGSRSLIRSTFLHSGIQPVSGEVVEEDYQFMSSIL